MTHVRAQPSSLERSFLTFTNFTLSKLNHLNHHFNLFDESRLSDQTDPCSIGSSSGASDLSYLDFDRFFITTIVMIIVTEDLSDLSYPDFDRFLLLQSFAIKKQARKLGGCDS